MKYILVIFSLIYSLTFLSQDRLVSYTYLTADNAYQTSLKQYVGYDKSITIHPSDTNKSDKILHIIPLVGFRDYYYNNKSNQYSDFRVNTSFKYDRNLCFGLNASLIHTNNWTPLLYDGFIRWSRKRISTELFREHELVGTPTTNDLRYTSTFTGLSVDYRLNRYLTVVNGISYNRISDGNDRWYYIGRIICSIGDRSYFDFKTRQMWGGEWSPYYFSPQAMAQYNIGYGFYKPIMNEKLMMKFYFGSGVQVIDKDRMAMFNLDVKITTNFKSRWNAELQLGSRNFNTYVYNMATLKITYNLFK